MRMFDHSFCLNVDTRFSELSMSNCSRIRLITSSTAESRPRSVLMLWRMPSVTASNKSCGSAYISASSFSLSSLKRFSFCYSFAMLSLICLFLDLSLDSSLFASATNPLCMRICESTCSIFFFYFAMSSSI